MPQELEARKSTPFSQALNPAQFAMQTDASHVIGNSLHDSLRHSKSQSSDSHDTPPLHAKAPVQTSVHECPPTHLTPSQPLAPPHSIVQSLPGGHAMT